MENKTLGATIACLRKEKGMTQADLAEKMGVTDKAVSKWERDLSCPDIGSVPKLAEILGVSLDELLQSSAAPRKKAAESPQDMVRLVCRTVALAMGVAVTALSALGKLDTQTGVSLLGLGLACAGLVLLRENP